MRALLARVSDTVEVPLHLQSEEGAVPGAPCVPNDRRRFARRRMGGSILCQITGPLPAFPQSGRTHKVITLDISRSGISYLADQQQFPEEEVLLWTLIGRIPCKVARCLKHNDRCYEIGVEICK